MAIKTVPPWWVWVNPFAYLLWGVDIICWFLGILIGRGPIAMCRKLYTWNKQKAIEVVGKTGDKILRHVPSYVNEPVDVCKGCTTVFDAINETAHKNPDEIAMLNRRFVRTDTQMIDGKKIQKGVFAETDTIRWSQLWANCLNFGKGLRQIGMQSCVSGDDLTENITSKKPKPSSILIYEDTSVEWTTAFHGAFSQSIVVTTSYATLGISSVVEAINEGKITTVVCNWSVLDKLIEQCEQNCPTLKNVIYTTHRLPSDNDFKEPKHKKIDVYSHQSVIDLGAGTNFDVTPPTLDLTAVVMYTSGSTGKPKGVVLTHKNLAAACRGLLYTAQNDLNIVAGSRYIAYLPCAHIFEMVVEVVVLAVGATLCFACPRTISSRGAKRLMPDGKVNEQPGYPYPPGAIQEYRPQVMVAVPKIWDLLKTGVEDTIAKASPVVKFLFQTAYSGKVFAMRQGRTSPLFDLLVFRKTKSLVGGHLGCGVNGGGPIHPRTQEFVQAVFCIDMTQGLGMTETTIAGAIQMLGTPRFGTCGQPMPMAECKLLPTEIQDKDRIPYKPSDKMHYNMPCNGRGELCWGGDCIMSGYLLQKGKTDEVLFKDADGVWLRSGDVGVWTPEGEVMIVDRVKNIVKLKGGEYCAIEHIEGVYGTAPFIDKMAGGIMCHADGHMDRPCAFIQVSTKGVLDLAKAAGVEETDIEVLCVDPKVTKAALKHFAQIAKDENLGANEGLKAVLLPQPNTITFKALMVHLISGAGDGNSAEKNSPWTPENEYLTASNKLNRANIRERLQEELQSLRKSCGAGGKDGA